MSLLVVLFSLEEEESEAEYIIKNIISLSIKL